MNSKCCNFEYHNFFVIFSELLFIINCKNCLLISSVTQQYKCAICKVLILFASLHQFVVLICILLFSTVNCKMIAVPLAFFHSKFYCIVMCLCIATAVTTCWCMSRDITTKRMTISQPHTCQCITTQPSGN